MRKSLVHSSLSLSTTFALNAFRMGRASAVDDFIKYKYLYFCYWCLVAAIFVMDILSLLSYQGSNAKSFASPCASPRHRRSSRRHEWSTYEVRISASRAATARGAKWCGPCQDARYGWPTAR